MREVTCDNCKATAYGQSTHHTLATSTINHDPYCYYNERSFVATRIGLDELKFTSNLDKNGNAI